ncbi:MAG TPA: DUF4180 domain-containing protein [Syntrophomonadaceae bacterium]|nr:DUF4180 domain-containing protein [Syntrophomonadaceae bacterium]
MDYRVKETGNKRYIECIEGNECLKNEQDALELVVICHQNDAGLLILHEENIAQDFFELKTGVAGNILQKFINYSIKVAAVLEPERVKEGRFREMVIEANQGSHFRVFHNYMEAEEWLIR